MESFDWFQIMNAKQKKKKKARVKTAEQCCQSRLFQHLNGLEKKEINRNK